MLSRLGAGLPLLGLAGVMADDAGRALAATGDGSDGTLRVRAPHFPGRAKRVIHFFANGGPSHVDTFDPKPMLEKYAGKAIPFNLKTERQTGAALPTAFKFSKHGESGLEISDAFPYLSACADDLCVVRSMVAERPSHGMSLLLMNTGEQREPRPSVGSWITYGLGTENQNLPGFVAMCPGGYPVQGADNWRCAFLPGAYQATYIDPKKGADVAQLIPHIQNQRLSRAEQRRQLDLLARLNREHVQSREGDALIDARIHAHELAFNMQFAATDAFDVRHEPNHIRDLYGPGVHARQCLIARRLVERGVRYVQMWHGGGQPWDLHDKIAPRLRVIARQCDQALAALLVDLKQRGMLDDTLVLFSGEFGRTPTVELPASNNQGSSSGRDHNHYGFSVWMAGGGVKGGYAHGATDDFGFRAVTDRVHVHDLHATMLHLLGFDHKRLTYRHAGRDYRLTDIHGEVVKQILA